MRRTQKIFSLGALTFLVVPLVSLLSAQASLALTPDGAPVTTTTAATASTTTTTLPVSGEAAPSAPPSGYHTTLIDSFPSSTLSSFWVPFSGTPSGDPTGQWSPSHLVVGNGELQIQGYGDPAYAGRWTSGGALLLPRLGQTYGEYQVRMRIDPGQGTGFDLLLWPTAGGSSNGYIDFGSDNSGTGGGSRQVLYASLHAASGAVTTSTTPVDLTSWHTIGVIGPRPGLLHSRWPSLEDDNQLVGPVGRYGSSDETAGRSLRYNVVPRAT